ncbi:MAG TPA: amidohydrolase family protein [Candidatus Acidoferrales bacterium]|nr:amidohydrolase family protein [Candidatus Acidoferrales bacterium]
MDYDLLIKGGRIYDGSGLPSYLGDVGVRAGKIVELGRLNGGARRVVQADGLAVAPGFIDFHTHLDAQLLWDPLATSSCWHGITTVIPGNCGLALAPARPQDHEGILKSFVRVEAMPMAALKAGVSWEWTSFPEYLRKLDQRLGVNVAALMGHCAVRQYVMGEEACARAATPDEIRRMQDLVREGMRAGAIGFSTNQNPVHMRDDGKPIPSRLATEEEILALAEVLGELNAGSVQISQGSLGVSNETEKAVGFFGRLAEASGRPVIWQSIAHRWDRPDLWREQLKMAEEILARGIPSYPLCNARLFNNRFTLKNAQVFDDLPTWKNLMFVPEEKRAQLFRDPEVRAKLRFEGVEDRRPSRFSRRWDLVYFIKAARPEHRPLERKSVAEIARLRGQDVIDAFLDLSLEEGLEAQFQTSSTNGDEAAVAEILRSPFTLVGQSDAGAHLIYDAGYGYATRFLGYWIRERNAMTLEEGIRKLTFMVASVFGLHDRGLLRPGMAADLVLFDPETVSDSEPEMASDLPAGEKRLVQKARGVKMTVVNGEVLTEDGEHTGAFPGRVLRNIQAGL